MLHTRNNHHSKKVEEHSVNQGKFPENGVEEREETLYTIKKSFWGRVHDIIYSIIGNGYDLVTKPHTATWLALFMMVVIYYTCFIKTPSIFKGNSAETLGDTMNNIRSGVIVVCLFIIVFGANQVVQRLPVDFHSSKKVRLQGRTRWSGKSFWPSPSSTNAFFCSFCRFLRTTLASS